MVCLNAGLRTLSTSLSGFQIPFLRYAIGTCIIAAPILLRSGVRGLRSSRPGAQFGTGAVMTLALLVWFAAVQHVTIAEITAIAFTSPIFIMAGAVLFLGERLHWDRLTAALVGFAGVLIVVYPRSQGIGGVHVWLMLASSPLFSAAYMMTKALTRHDTPDTIVLWQSLTVATFTLPFALLAWQAPSLSQWLLCAACALLGSAANYSLARAYAQADISATQSVKFLDLVWASMVGWIFFGDMPNTAALAGGSLICAAAFWIVKREARRRPALSG